MRALLLIALSVVTSLICGSVAADHPECETWEATQPDSMVTNVLLIYTWEDTCPADPVLGPLERDGEVIDVTWNHDLDSNPHEHTAWDNGVEPAVHSYDLTVTPEGEDSYVLHDALLVTGTAPVGDAGPDSGPDADADADGDADGDSDGDQGGGSSDGGCSLVPNARSSGISLLGAILALVG
jgi:hypothetical protein